MPHRSSGGSDAWKGVTVGSSPLTPVRMTHARISLLPFPRLLRLLSVFALLVGIFWFDLSMPLGASVPVLYVIPVRWIALWSGRRETVALILTGLTATVLIVLRYGFATTGQTDLAVINRLLPSCVVWTTVLLALFRKVQEEDRKMRETLSQVLQKLIRRRWQ
jgi:hypothetical protein